MYDKLLEITSNTLIERTGPSTAYEKSGVRMKGDLVYVEEESGQWVKIMDGGWINTKNIKGENTVKPGESGISLFTTYQPSNTIKDVQSDQIKKDTKQESDIPDWYKYELKQSSDQYNSESDYLSFLMAHMDTTSMRGIHGIPYQFLPSVDRRIDDSDSNNIFGRKFAERIITQMPLALLSPGVPKFMPNYSKDDKKSIAASLLANIGNKLSGDNESTIQNIMNRQGRYYDFINKLPAYFSHVDPMCRMSAALLGIGFDDEYTIDGYRLSKYSWWRERNEDVQGVLNTTQCVAFYVDSDTSFDESFSNQTGESMIASKVNSISDAAREINFLMGNGMAMAGIQADAISEEIDSSLEEFDSWLDKVTSSNFIKSVAHNAITVVSGARMIFPEIWNDSSFSRNHSLKFKFVSPDHDKFSIWLNCIVPMLHCIGFVAPRQVSDAPNAYESPYLIRAFYKGAFNIDMGIVDSLSITKGAEGMWTVDGLPTVIEIEMSIKELYSKFMITYCGTSDYIKNIGQASLTDNIMLMDWIANTCGININKPDVTRKLAMYRAVFEGNTADILSGRHIFSNIESTITAKINNLYRSF